MKVIQVCRKFFAFIFSVVFAILVLLVLFTGIARFMIMKDNISKYITNLDIFSYSSNEVSELGKGTLKESVSKELLEMKISEEVTEKVLDSDELNGVLTDYVYSYINNVLFDVDRQKIDTDAVMTIVQNKYFEVESKHLTDNQINMLSDYVSLLSDKFDNATFSVNELEELGVNVVLLRTIANVCASKYIFFILGTLILGMYALIAICFSSKLKSFKWCSSMLTIDGVILVVFSLLEVKFLSMYFNSRGIVDGLMMTIADVVLDNLLFLGIALMIIGIILLIICSVLWKRERKQNSDMLLESVIEEEVKAIKTLENHKITNDEDLEKTLKDLDKIEIENKVLDEEKNSDDTNDVKNEDDSVSDAIDKAIEDDSTSNDIDKVIEKDSLNEEAGEETKEDNVDDNTDLEVEEAETDVEENENTLEEVDSNEKDEEIEEKLDNMEIVENENYLKEEDIEDFSDIKEFEIIETENDEEQEDEKDSDIEINNLEYEELDDKIEKEIIKKDVDAFPVEEVKLNIVSPEKGKDVEVDLLDLEKEEDEDIEIL